MWFLAQFHQRKGRAGSSDRAARRVKTRVARAQCTWQFM